MARTTSRTPLVIAHQAVVATSLSELGYSTPRLIPLNGSSQRWTRGLRTSLSWVGVGRDVGVGSKAGDRHRIGRKMGFHPISGATSCGTPRALQFRNSQQNVRRRRVCITQLAPSRISIATTPEDRWRNAMSYESLCLFVELHVKLTRDLHRNLTHPMSRSMAQVTAGFLGFTSLLLLVELFLKR